MMEGEIDNYGRQMELQAFYVGLKIADSLQVSKAIRFRGSEVVLHEHLPGIG